VSVKALACAALVLLIPALTACGGSSNGQRAPASVERALPIDLYLANLCPDAETDGKIVKKLRRQANALLREARAHPDWLVEFTYYDDHGDDDRELISIRQLAKEHLQSIKDEDPDCEPGLQRQLEAVTQ
jgi:hypothetical protein